MSEEAKQSLFEKLFAVDLTDQKDKKGQFTYLSWTDAWQIINQECNNVDYEIHDDVVFPDGTVEVRVTVEIDGSKRMMWLPVKNHQQKAIVNPDARQVSDARMRCLVKCLAMFGLGLYIYQGEDIPKIPVSESNEYLELKQRLEEDEKGFILWYLQLDEDTQSEILQSAAPHKKITEWKQQVRDATTRIHQSCDEWAAQLIEWRCDEEGKENTDSIGECMVDFDPYERFLVMARMDESDKDYYRNIYLKRLNNGTGS
jgi:hypothetical protein